MAEGLGGEFPELIARAASAAGLETALTRRGFLKLSLGAFCGLAALGLGEIYGANAPLVILDNAQGMLLADPTRCVACLRCELACTEYNDGLAQPSLARIKVGRAVDFGPEGPTGGPGGHGDWGDGLIVQSVCRQCPHPVPCATACPENAIQADPATGTRFIDQAACVGCRLCLRACPWDMIVFDEARGRASKCFLCNGRPKCVEACPAAALHFVPWRDLTHAPALRPTASVVAPDRAQACLDCHSPGRGLPPVK
jgi:Fe-S-cluster-containing dehydrogenase component